MYASPRNSCSWATTELGQMSYARQDSGCMPVLGLLGFQVFMSVDVCQTETYEQWLYASSKVLRCLIIASGYCKYLYYVEL